MLRSIRTKFLITQMGFVLTVALVLGLATYFIMFQSLRKSRMQYLEYAAVHIEEKMSILIAGKEQLLEKIAASEMVTNYAKKQQENMLVGHFGRFMPEFAALSYVNDHGIEEIELVHGETTAKILDKADSILIERLKQNPNKTLNTYLAFSPETAGPCIEFGFLNKSFFDEFLGIILGKVSVVELSKNIQETTVGKSGSVILLDSQGTILSCKDSNSILQKIVIDGTESEKVIAATETGASGHGRAKILGVDSYFAYTPVSGQDWVVMTILPYREFATALNNLRNTVLLIGFGILIVGVVLSLLLARNMTGSILKLVQGTNLIAKGDFSYKINTKSQDEIGTLAKSFNRMAEDLGKTTTSVVNLNREIAVRRKVETSLRQSEKRFEEVAESSGDWIWEINSEGLYTYSSPVVEKLLGYKPAEIVGKKHFYDFFAPEQREELKKTAFEAFAKQNEFKGLINPNIHKNGSTVILETHGTPIVDNKGNLTGYRGADRDITERKRAEERLLAVNSLQENLLPLISLEQKLKFITDAVVRILDADFARIWTIKPGDRCDAGCIHANVAEGPHVCRFRDKCLHLTASSGRYTHLDGKEHRRVPFGCYKIGLIAAGEQAKFLTNKVVTDPHVHNHDWARKLGLVSFAGYRLTHTNGEPIGVLALFSKHSISPEEDALLEGIAHSTSMVLNAAQAEESLRKNEEFTRRVIESSSDCIKVLDLEGRLLSMSGGGQKILEIDDITPYLNASFIDYWKGKEREDCLEAVAKAKQGKTGIFYGYFETAKGTPKWWEVIVTPIKDSDGKINRLLAVSRDITERKKSEKSIENLNKDLKSTVALLTQSNRQLREFAHLAAHDLKTPLRGISTLAQWLVNDYKEKFDDAGRRQVDLLVERVERMNELVNAILEYSTIGRDRRKEHPVDLNRLVGTVLVETKPPANIKITINKKLPVVVCEETHLRQVFHRLLANAVRFMDKPEGRITIDYTDKDDLWEFSVSDNGPGIAPQHFERIFQLFQSLNESDQSKGEGTGLTFVRKIVELYGGQIWLTSELGQGSTFFFTLPKDKAVVENVKLETNIVG
ncbi:MAG: PAS domain S-box protein [Phycisphaerae bacterium]|nr:PAS domain S-box protein [Phycisphaerae bacterium]